MSIFDPDSFLNQTVESEFETRRRDVPEGEYPAYVKKVTPLEVNTKNGTRHQLMLTWVVDDETARMATGLDEPTVTQKIWLDLDDNNNLKSGPNANLQLGRIRAALGQNKAGKKWNMGMLEGAAATIHVGTRTVNEDRDGNPLDEPMVFTEVNRVAKA